MARARIAIDPKTGALAVPDEPVIALVPGDGEGPKLVRAAKLAIDAAVSAAYAGRRRIHWDEHPAGAQGRRALGGTVPDATMNAIRVYRVALAGPVEPLADEPELNQELDEVLDFPLAAALAQTAAGPLALAWEVREGSGAQLEVDEGSTDAGALWQALRDGTPEGLRAFGIDLADDEIPTAGLAVQAVSRLGTTRFVEAAARLAKTLGATEAVLLHESELAPQTDGRFLEWALATGALELRPMRAAVALSQLLSGTLPGPLVLSQRHLAMRLLLAGAPADLDVASMRTNPETGHAVFGTLQAHDRETRGFGMLRAGGLLLSQLGWVEAAQALEKALSQVGPEAPTPGQVAEQVAALVRG